MHKKWKKRDVYEYMGAGLPEYFEGKLVYVGRPRMKVKIKKKK
jgi:hypothetical protein